MTRIEISYGPPEKLNELAKAVLDEEGVELTVGLRPDYPELISAIENPNSFDVSCIDISEANLPMLKKDIKKPLCEYDKKVAHSIALLALCGKYRVKPFWNLIFEDDEPKIEYSGYDFGYFSRDAIETFCGNPNSFADDSFKWFGVAFRNVLHGSIGEAQRAVRQFLAKGYMVREMNVNAGAKYIIPNYQGREEDDINVRAIKDTIIITSDFEMSREDSSAVKSGIEVLLNEVCP